MKKAKRLFSNKFFLLAFLFLLLVGINSLSLIIHKPARLQSENMPAEQKLVQSQTTGSGVLSAKTQAPQIYIYGNNQGYSSGGMITLASTEEPAVVIGGYNLSGEVEIILYEANEGALLDYLTHDKDGKQTRKNPDVNKFKYVTTVKQPINANSYQGTKIPLPLGEIGIWYLKVKMGSVNTDVFAVRSNIGVLAKEGNNEFIFWGQNLKTKRGITDGVIKILNLRDGRKELQTVSFNAEGIAKADLNAEADIALVSQNSDRAVVPINLKYLNTGYSYQQFKPEGTSTKYFIFTDRPLYKPGDSVNFKAVLRNDDDARYKIPGGDVLVKIYAVYDDINPVLEKNYSISPDGTISGQYELPATTKVGYYTLSMDIPSQQTSSATISFDVEFFRKPEFSIDITAPNTELIAGDKNAFKISGTYFSGQPLLGQKVKYTVFAADFYEYQYLTDQQNLSQILGNDYRYGYWYGNNKVTEGTATLDNNGEAKIDIDTKMSFNQGKTQVFSVEASIDDGSQNPSFSRKNILIYAGEYGIYRKDTSYGVKVNTPLQLPVSLIPYRGNSDVAGIALTAKLHRVSWVSFQEPDQKYLSYRREEEDLPELSAKTDKQGNAAFTFTPTKTGSYTATVEGKDGRGNLISKVFYSYVSADDQPYYSESGENEITVSTDKQKYLPTDTVHFNIFSQTPDRDVFLSLERGRVDRFKIIHLSGKSSAVDIPLINTDIPNMFAKVSSFSSSDLDSNQAKILVSSEGKKIAVSITPDSKTYGPGETATVNVATTDVGGNPVSAELALWSVDKAIFELSDNKLGDVFKTFWDERYNSTQEAYSLQDITVRMVEMGGCFASGTKVLMSDQTLKNIEEVKVGDAVLTRNSPADPGLVKAKVLKVHTADEAGYLIINGTLKVTANHIIRVNSTWKEAGSIQIGDKLSDSRGQPVAVHSIEWQRGRASVYNLEIEKYHTYFADGVWVHNAKGADRNAFKDTAYWNPSIRTDASGRAQVSFKLPDNLTTWTLAAVASTQDTRVGQGTSEIVVTKDIIVRPIIPNILRLGDEIILSALVQNFTQTDSVFGVDLKFDSGSVEQADRPEVQIKSNGMQQFYWKVKPETEKEKSKLIFSARVKDNVKLADVVTQEIPVRAFGFEERRAQVGNGAKTFAVKLSPDADKEKSKFTLSLSPTILGTLPTAMKYLVDYPYGCVEQTTSRFVPAVIAKLNQDLFAGALTGKDVDAMMQKGLARLSTQQQSDGGWTWWYSGRSDPFITVYVVEYILQAGQAGAKVDQDLLEQAKNYLIPEGYYDYNENQQKTYSRDEMVAKIYGLTLLGEKSKIKKLTDFNNISPDVLSLAVMANYLNGDTNPQSNGLALLMSMAKTQGDGVFWEGGSKVNFGSNDASTALAIRAIVLAGGDRNLAVSGAKYLTRARRAEYWSNTYATAQVIRALVELSKTGEELVPAYKYSVLLDGKQITQGAVSNPKQIIKDIDIPVASIKPDGSDIVITKNGDGQIYSTLVINEFHTDKNAKAANSGLSVKREYVNEKGSEYSLGVGDTVIIKITVDGLKTAENYGVISDELPSGLVPVNESFNNEQYGNNSNSYYTSYNVTDREITENGMVLSLYQIAAGEHIYTYKARVVSEGTFLVPPATASLMYAPEIYGRSEVQTVKIDTKSKFTARKISETPPTLPQTLGQKAVVVGVALLLIMGIGIFIAWRNGVTLQSIKDRFKKQNP